MTDPNQIRKVKITLVLSLGWVIPLSVYYLAHGFAADVALGVGVVGVIAFWAYGLRAGVLKPFARRKRDN